MKKVILLLTFCAFFIFPSPARCAEDPQRGLFVAMLEEHTVLSSRKDIEGLVYFAKKNDIKVLFVQIYRANQAWFPSNIADTTPYEKCFKNVGEDPFGLLIKRAHGAGIQVHAWLNMLSLGENSNSKLLKKYGPGVLTRNVKSKKALSDYKIDGQYFLEPGDLRVRHDLLDMVKEILTAYPELDGIQFDYIRYPDMHPFYGHTKINIERFKKASGLKTVNEGSNVWKSWKRDQVTEFLETLVKETRALRPDIQISTTGCLPYSRAYDEAFQNWPGWLKSSLVDFVTIMSYSVSLPELSDWIAVAKEKTGDLKKVNIAIGAYKLTHDPDTFKKEFEFAENAGCRACVIFHYGSLLQNPALGYSLIKSRKPQ